MTIENGISTVQDVQTQAIQLGQGKIKDVKFLDDRTLLVLWKSSGELQSLSSIWNCISPRIESTCLLSIPYRIADAAHYSPSKAKAAPRTTTFNDDEVLEQFSKYRIPSDGSFTPHKLDVREQTDKGNKTETMRIVVLGQDRLRYKVFSLPMQNHGIAGVDEDVPMSER
jgi:anaphase-promoting complex subunit 4